MAASLEAWNERVRGLFGLSLHAHPARLRDGVRAACKELGLDDDHALLILVDRADPAAKVALARSLTISETYFFREPQHFDLLRETLLPAAIARRSLASGPVVLVSAACCSGEEAYSMAIVARQVLGAAALGRVHVLGFDLNDRSVAAARRGVYRPWSLRGVADDLRKRWFDHASDTWSVTAESRALTTFEVRNLIHADDALAPASADVIFCRNVLIYLDDPSVALVLKRLSEALRPGGSLIVASAEAGLLAAAKLGVQQVGDVWVHTHDGPPSPRAAEASARPPAPTFTPRVAATASPSRSSLPPAAPEQEVESGPAVDDATRWLDEGWAALAADPVSAGEQARRAILLDRTLASAHVLAASAALAQSDTSAARRSLRHARRCLATMPAGDVVRGAGGATAAEMASYCARLERTLAAQGS